MLDRLLVGNVAQLLTMREVQINGTRELADAGEPSRMRATPSSASERKPFPARRLAYLACRGAARHQFVEFTVHAQDLHDRAPPFVAAVAALRHSPRAGRDPSRHRSGATTAVFLGSGGVGLPQCRHNDLTRRLRNDADYVSSDDFARNPDVEQAARTRRARSWYANVVNTW